LLFIFKIIDLVIVFEKFSQVQIAREVEYEHLENINISGILLKISINLRSIFGDVLKSIGRKPTNKGVLVPFINNKRYSKVFGFFVKAF
jgi:hypothetical protein